jgi:hypothetical protein
MITIGQDTTRFRDCLLSPHTMGVRVQLCDLDGNHKKDLAPYFMDGQVNVDATAQITRSLDMSLIDPLGRLDLEPDSPSPTSVFIADLVRVWIVLREPVLGDVYEVPVFTGPIDAVTRSDMFLDVKCVGKEKLALDNVWVGKTFHKNQKKTDVIKRILRDLVGEKNISIPNRGAKLSKDLKITQDENPWEVASRLAASMNCQLFYDGRGVAKMRNRKQKPVLTLTEKWVSDTPQVSYDLSGGVYNAVRVVGGKPKKAKKKVTYKAVAGRRHPLSPWRLGRGGVPRFITFSVEDDSLRTKKECAKLAKALLKSGLSAGIAFTVDGIMDPRLEENDPIRIDVGSVSVTSPTKTFTIPLTAGDDGAYGYAKRIEPKGGARILKRHKHKHRSKSRGNSSKGRHKANGKKG